MTNDQKVKAIEEWQKNDRMHPMTCGMDSKHELLVPRTEDGTVVLKCPTCGLRQHYVPDIVYESYKSTK